MNQILSLIIPSTVTFVLTQKMLFLYSVLGQVCYFLPKNFFFISKFKSLQISIFFKKILNQKILKTARSFQNKIIAACSELTVGFTQFLQAFGRVFKFFLFNKNFITVQSEKSHDINFLIPCKIEVEFINSKELKLFSSNKFEINNFCNLIIKTFCSFNFFKNKKGIKMSLII